MMFDKYSRFCEVVNNTSECKQTQNVLLTDYVKNNASMNIAFYGSSDLTLSCSFKNTEIGRRPEPSRKIAHYTQLYYKLFGKIMHFWVCYIFLVIFSAAWANHFFWDIYWITFGKSSKRVALSSQ